MECFADCTLGGALSTFHNVRHARPLCVLRAGAAAEQKDNELSASEAPLVALESTMSDANVSLHPGLGCGALPNYAYPEDSHAGLGSQDAVRPLYDR